MVTNSLTRGGAERQTALWATICERLGHEVEILAMYQRPAAEYPVPDSTRVEYLRKSSRLDLPRMARSVRALGQRVDVMVGFQAYCGLLCALARFRAPWLFVAGGDPRRLRDTSRMPASLLRFVASQAAAACAPTRGVVDVHRELGIGPRSGAWMTLPNIVDDAGFVDGSGDREGALFVGRFVPEKNPLLAIESAIAADASLTFLGWGALKPELERVIADADYGARVSFESFTPAPWELYARARVLLLTSEYETFGNVIVESLAAGTPVVSVDCDFGPREVLAGASYSHVVARDRDAVAAALRAVLERPYSPVEADECRRFAERYTTTSIAPLIDDALSLTLAHGRRGVRARRTRLSPSPE